MLKISPKIRNSDTEFPYWPQCTERIEIYGSEGLNDPWPDGRRVAGVYSPQAARGSGQGSIEGPLPRSGTQGNFLDCVRTRKTPNADIVEGHRSTLLAHLANISYRLSGQKLIFDAQTEKIVGNDEAMKFYRREEYRKPYVIDEQV